MNLKSLMSLMFVAAAGLIVCDQAAATHRHYRPLPPPVAMTVPEQSYYCVRAACNAPPPVLPYPGLQIRPVPLPAPLPPPIAAPVAPRVRAVPAGGICLIQQAATGNGFYDLVLNHRQLLYQGYGPNVEEMLRYYQSTGICRR